MGSKLAKYSIPKCVNQNKQENQCVCCRQVPWGKGVWAQCSSVTPKSQGTHAPNVTMVCRPLRSTPPGWASGHKCKVCSQEAHHLVRETVKKNPRDVSHSASPMINKHWLSCSWSHERTRHLCGLLHRTDHDTNPEGGTLKTPSDVEQKGQGNYIKGGQRHVNFMGNVKLERFEEKTGHFQDNWTLHRW